MSPLDWILVADVLVGGLSLGVGIALEDKGLAFVGALVLSVAAVGAVASA